MNDKNLVPKMKKTRDKDLNKEDKEMISKDAKPKIDAMDDDDSSVQAKKIIILRKQLAKRKNGKAAP